MVMSGIYMLGGNELPGSGEDQVEAEQSHSENSCILYCSRSFPISSSPGFCLHVYERG